MGTTYQHPQYTNYAARHHPPYSVPSVGQDSYAGAYTGASAAPRQYSTQSQTTAQVPVQIPASALRNEVQNVLPPYRQPSSPVPSSRTNILGPVEEQPRRKSTNGDMILPDLQIPSSINNSGGSLAEFAAQVRMRNFCSRICIDLSLDYLPVLVRIDRYVKPSREYVTIFIPNKKITE
jgi:hypothetical protein